MERQPEIVKLHEGAGRCVCSTKTSSILRLILAFFRLTRGLNLLYIVLTQVLFQYCVIVPLSEHSAYPFAPHPQLFRMIVLSSVLIAAAGYIINDYFDLNIDQVNKPGKIIVDHIISRRWALFFHMIFSMTGVVISFYSGWKYGTMSISFINMICVMLLWVYSTTLKKKILSGNIIISALTAWVILVLYAATIDQSSFQVVLVDRNAFQKLTRIAILYAAFAFIVSLVREVVKDMEDMDGDARYGCRTMPIAWGIPVSKVFIAVWMIVLITALLIVQFYVLIQFGWWLSAGYCLLMIIIPLLMVITKLRNSSSSEHFHYLSQLVKFVMLTGVLSMLFLRYLL